MAVVKKIKALMYQYKRYSYIFICILSLFRILLLILYSMNTIAPQETSAHFYIRARLYTRALIWTQMNYICTYIKAL